MAKAQINTKSRSYMRDKEAFMKELRQFNDSKNIALKPPIVNGIEIDLYLFYSLVQQRGGIGKVNQTDVWESFLRPLRLPHPCINGSTLLRRIYATHLEKFERAKGPPGRDDDMDIEEELTRRGRGSNMPRITFSGGTYISASGEALRTIQRPTASHSERLALSLLSPMPNEQDFAVNVCTVLAADHSNRLPLSTTPHILDFLLAHAGVYNHPSLRDTIGRSYFEARGRYPDEFWKMRAGGGGAKELADESKFIPPGLEDQPELMVQAMAAHNTLTDALNMDGADDDSDKISGDYDVLEDWVTEPSEESQLFAPALAGGANCVYTQRVLQIASIVRSLSFHEENVQYLAKNTTLIRFLLLCANCWVGTLRQSGLDTLGNVATELIIKDPATCLISRHVLSTIQSALVSPDRARVLAALELLNKLAQNELNEDALLKALEEKVYADVCSMLTLRDIMVLVCTLECVYALTSLGVRASEAVARVRGLVGTLVSLVTVEAQSYGPKACILMRVVETVSGPAALAAVAEREPLPQQPQQPPPQPQTPQKQLVTSHEPAPPATPSTTLPAPAPINTLQQSHMQQRTVQENEHFALAWLRSSYEPLPPSDNSTYDAAELYRLYLACCTKLNRKGVIAPAHFPRLVRTVFGGTVGPNTATLATGETQQVYIGIRPRNVPGRTNTQPAGPASPILKAQLTNKPGTDVKPSAPPTQQATAPHPHLSQALESNPTNTTLIKHLLAHKVSPAQQTAQVAQRQQNQQQGRAGNTVVVQAPSQAMEVDPEAMIKCTAITPGGIASITPVPDKVASEDLLGPKEEPVQIQIDEQTQLTIKSNQNKMLADLLEKKSNPPVQVVQMTSQVGGGAPTIQITESGHIVQVKQDAPMIQINESGLVQSGGQFYQIKNDQGQLIHIKNDQGQIIQLKGDQLQPQLVPFKHESVIQSVQMKPEPVPQLIQGVVQIKADKDSIAEHVVTDHSYTEPPAKKIKADDKRDSHSPQETASKTAANLYAALAASALEDEEDLLPPKQEPEMQSVTESQSMIIQEPILQVQQPTMQVQQPTLVQQPTMQVQQPTLQVQGNTIQMQQQMQVQQPMLQVQPMDVQNILTSQSGQIIIQDKSMGQQQQFVQQPMQIIATPSNSQGGISYIAQNIPSNMMQKTIIIVQGPTGGGPLTLTVNNPAGLDEATLNSLIAQATEAITQQQIIQNAGMLQSGQRVIVSQPTLVSSSQPIQTISVVKQAIAQNQPQLTQSQQPIITTQPQPHKAQIVNQGQIVNQQGQIVNQQGQIVNQPQQIVMSQKNPPPLISTSTGNPIGGPQMIVSNNQQIIMNAPMKSASHKYSNIQQQRQSVVNVVESKPSNSKSQQPVIRQVITRQPVMVGNTKIGDKETIVNQPVAEKPPPAPPVPKPAAVATPPPKTPPLDDTPWICHWRGCGKSFQNAAEVFNHAARVHCPSGAGGEAPCLWLDCDRVPRRTFALLNHLTDKHCTVQALKAIYHSRKTAAAEADANKPVTLGYPPNAALAALNKHAADMFNPRELMHRAELSRTPLEQTDENEGPVTKSIRLTAALILRNIVIYSNTGRRQLRSYESHLSSIAISNVEASRTIAQVLYDMNNI